MKDLGELRYFLGIEFSKKSQWINMHQRKYALELISETGLSASRPCNIPIDNNIKLTSKQYDEYNDNRTAVDPLVDQETYQKLIGKLLYLTVTRPDIAFPVQTLSQFLQQPKQSHMNVSMRIVKYIKMQPGQGILMSSNCKNTVSAYWDAIRQPASLLESL